MAFSWSWPAFFFSFAWFAFRKQWLIAAIMIIVPLAIGHFTNSGGGLAGLAVVMAMYAKSLYLQDAVIKIAKIKADGGGADRIAAAGGVSIPGGIAGGILWTISIAGAIYTTVAEGGAP